MYRKILAIILSLSGLGYFNLATANDNASIAVNNMSNATLYLFCELANNTRFYAYPNQQSHDFTIPPTAAPSIDIYVVKEDPSSGPNLICINHLDTQDQFSYRLDQGVEQVRTSGHFHYDPAYPGSLLFESH